MLCPFCGSDNVEVPMTDIGIGEVQCAQATCWNCEAIQFHPYHDNSKAEPDEQKVGWYKGRRIS